MDIRCYDNGGVTIDRYTVVFMDSPEHDRLFTALAMDESPFHPQGFGQHTEARPGRHLGKRIKFTDLPADCQRLVDQEYTS